jgi:hypothetical protein
MGNVGAVGSDVLAVAALFGVQARGGNTVSHKKAGPIASLTVHIWARIQEAIAALRRQGPGNCADSPGSQSAPVRLNWPASSPLAAQHTVLEVATAGSRAQARERPGQMADAPPAATPPAGGSDSEDDMPLARRAEVKQAEAKAAEKPKATPPPRAAQAAARPQSNGQANGARKRKQASESEDDESESDDEDEVRGALRSADCNGCIARLLPA